MGETHRFEYEKGNRDEFPQQDQEYPPMPTIPATSPELFTDERAASLVLATRDKFLLLKKWAYYLVYSSLSRFSTSISGERNADQIYKSFVCGQLISVVSAAIWWGFFGTVITFMMESDIAAGNARLVFNLMLIVVSPIARVISERAQMRSILVYVTMARSFVWCTYLPFVYLAGRYFGYKLIWETIGSAQFYAIIALDGALISLLNVVDLDCGGLSFLSHQFGIEITATQKSQAVYTHLTIFDASFILLNPILALSMLCSAVWYNSMRDSSAAPDFGVELEDLNRLDLSQSGIETPIIIIISVFQALSTASILLYRFGMPDSREPGAKSSEESGEYYMDIGQERAQRALESENHAFAPSPGSITKDIRSNISKFSEGFEFVSQDVNIRNRIFSLALETALEDAMASIILPLTIIHISKELLSKYSSESQNLSKYWASLSLLLVSIILGFGKLASLIITWRYKKEYIQSKDFEVNANNDFECKFSTNNHTISSESISTDNSYSKFVQQFLNETNINQLFLQISAADVSVIIIPASLSILKIYSEILIVQITCIFAICVFSAIFLACYSVPKIGLTVIYQLCIADEKKQGEISACSGIIVTLIDGITISAISLILHAANKYIGSFDIGLYIVSVIYLLHAIFECKYATKYRIQCVTSCRGLNRGRSCSESLSSV